jgi:protein TonB
VARAGAAYALSAALHLAALAGLAGMPALAARETVAVDIVDVPAPPPPPAPAAAPPAPLPEPAPPPRRPRASPPPPRDAPVAAADAPPPPNAPPPPDAPPPAPRAPVRVGVSMSATTQGGTVAAPAGNTLYGEMPREAPRPDDVAPYRAENYVPPTRLLRLPRIDCEEIPQSEFPERARRAGVEGTVRLRLVVDERGRVVEASVLDDPGHGLGPAAVAAAKRHCRSEPPQSADGAVTTSVVYKITFRLD